jgi:hypothetical protein
MTKRPSRRHQLLPQNGTCIALEPARSATDYGQIERIMLWGLLTLTIAASYWWYQPGHPGGRRGSRPVGLDRGPSPRLERDGIHDLAEKPGLLASAGALRRAMRRGFTESLRPIPVSFRCGGCGGR